MGLDKFVNAWMGGLFVVMLSFVTFLPIYWVYDHHTGTVRVLAKLLRHHLMYRSNTRMSVSPIARGTDYEVVRS